MRCPDSAVAQGPVDNSRAGDEVTRCGEAEWATSNYFVGSGTEYVELVAQHASEHDLQAAQRTAESAEEDAAFAIDYAYAAIDEAEYAVLDAALARMNADDLAEGDAKT